MRTSAAVRRERARPIVASDPTIYPVEERVGEDILQRWILELLRPMVASWLASRGVRAFVGADQFVYYRQFDSHSRCSPDILVIPGLAPDHRVRSWKIWEEGIVPTFLLEVVSRDLEKDYFTAPERYDEMGATELVVFDPDYERDRDLRHRFQVFRRTPRKGWMRVVATDSDRVQSKVLGCWIRSVGEGVELRLRLGTGARGDVLFPTEAERERREAERERREAERERREAERERREKALVLAALERERAAAQARISALEARLAKRKR